MIDAIKTYDEEAGSQSLLLRIGAGLGVPIVAVDTSPIIFKASLHAWYILNISSRLIASSALSSIIEF